MPTLLPRLAAIADAVRHVATLPDPVGQVTREELRPTGIRVSARSFRASKMRRSCSRALAGRPQAALQQRVR